MTFPLAFCYVRGVQFARRLIVTIPGSVTTGVTVWRVGNIFVSSETVTLLQKLNDGS